MRVRGSLGKDMRSISGEMEMIDVWVIEVYLIVKIVQIRSVHFILCEFYPTQIQDHKKKKITE